MLLTIGILAIVTLGVVLPRVRLPGYDDAAPLGWMSERWLAEHRASHPS